MINQTIGYFDSTMAEASEVEEIARGAYTSTLFANPAVTVLGLLMSVVVLAFAFTVSHKYTVGQREELAEAERRRIEEEEEKQQEIETYRSKIAKILESYAIHLTNLTSMSPLSRSNHNIADMNVPCSNNNSTRQISQGDEDEEKQDDTISVRSDSSEEAVEDIEAASTVIANKTIDSLSEMAPDTTCTVIQPTLAIGTDDQRQDETQISQPLSISSRRTFNRTNLREAVIDNPCAICLEPFRPGDDIVYCSNSVNGQRPHIFHQECSYDYIVNHKEGIDAPCPCCRTLLLPPEGQRRRCFENSSSVLTLQVAQGHETSEHEEQECNERDHQELESHEEDAESQESHYSSHDDSDSYTGSNTGSDTGSDASSGYGIEIEEEVDMSPIDIEHPVIHEAQNPAHR